MTTKVLIWGYISPSSLILIENTQKLKSRVSLRMDCYFAHLNHVLHFSCYYLLLRSKVFSTPIMYPIPLWSWDEPETKTWRRVVFTSYRASWHQEMEEWHWYTGCSKARGNIRDTDVTESLALLQVGQGQGGGWASQANFSLFSLHEASLTPQWELSYTVFSFLLNKHLEQIFCGHCFKLALYELPKGTSRLHLT